MANTIQLKLLDNKRIETYVNGYPNAYEGGYRIIAGEENATVFEISSVPSQYENATYSVTLTNSAGANVPAPSIVDRKFTLPAGMAIAGYGNILVTAVVEIDGVIEKVVWTPLKIKVYSDTTIPLSGGGGGGSGSNFNPSGTYPSLTAGTAYKAYNVIFVQELPTANAFSPDLVQTSDGTLYRKKTTSSGDSISYEYEEVGAGAVPEPTSDDAGKVLAVNAAGDGYELVEMSGSQIITLSSGDSGTLTTEQLAALTANPAGVTIALPIDSSNTYFYKLQLGVPKSSGDGYDTLSFTRYVPRGDGNSNLTSIANDGITILTSNGNWTRINTTFNVPTGSTITYATDSDIEALFSGGDN